MKDGVPCADVRGVAKDISVDFKTQISDQQIWATAIPVSSLRSNMRIHVPTWTRKSKGTQTQSESLEEYDIIEVDSSQSRQRLVLRRNAKAKHSVMLTLADPSQSAPTVALLDEHDEVAGEIHQLHADEIGEVSKLWNLLLENLTPLVKSRCSLSKISFGNRDISNFSHPSEVAETLLQQVAPLAREIRLRSRVPGELILKRATTKGRREEIFMSREDLQKQYESLPDQYRRVFDAMGLGNESTCDFVTMLGGKLDSRERPRSQRALSLDNTMDASLDSVLLSIEAA
jgi:hypothetical protein